MTGSGTTFASSSITVAAGSILVAVACGVNAAAASATFSDSVNGSTGWSTAKDVANNPLVLSMGWRYFSAGQTVTVTATYNTTVSQRGIKLLEITGAVTPGALDGTPAGQFQGSVGTGADAITSGSLTTAAQPALVVGACMNYGNNKNPAAGTGFTSTRVDWNTDVAGCRLEYQRVTATGTQAATYTGPSLDSWLTIAIAFDEATAAATPVLARHRQATWPEDEQAPPQRRARLVKDGTVAADTVLRPRRPWAWQEPEPWQSARRALLVPTAPVVTADTVLARQDAAAALSWWDAVDAPATRRVRLVPIAAAPPADQVPVRPDSLTLAWEPEPWQPQRRPRLVQQAVIAADTVLCRPDTWIAVLWWEAPAPDVVKRRRVLFPGTAPINTQVVRPPLVAKVDDAELAVLDTKLGNAAAVDSIDMAIAGDT